MGKISGDFEAMDLITLNQLLIERNNERRQEEGSLKVSNDYDRIIKLNNMIYQSWIENCLISRAKTNVSAKMVRNKQRHKS